MMAKRTVLLGMLICLTGAVAFGQPAVSPRTTGGDIGLFTMTTADSPRAGQFTLGFYGWYTPRIAGEIYDGQPSNTRYFTQFGGAGSLGLGLTDWWSVFVAGGAQTTRSGGGWQGGVINGHATCRDSFDFSGGSEDSRRDQDQLPLRDRSATCASRGWFSGLFPVSDRKIGNGEGEVVDTLNTGKTDWEWGAAVTQGLAHRHGVLHARRPAERPRRVCPTCSSSASAWKFRSWPSST